MKSEKIKVEENYQVLVAEAKKVGVAFNKVKKADLRDSLVKFAEAKEKEDAKPKAQEISAEHAKILGELTSKKEKVIKAVTEFGYPVAVVAKNPLVDCHPTNAHAIIRAAGLSTSGRVQSEETKQKIRATVLAKLEEAEEK